jgi:hypothetical protein
MLPLNREGARLRVRDAIKYSNLDEGNANAVVQLRNLAFTLLLYIRVDEWDFLERFGDLSRRPACGKEFQVPVLDPFVIYA